MAILLNVRDHMISYDPTAFIMKKARLYNDNFEYDIQNLIMDFSITESISNPTIICNCSFKDGLDLSGQFNFSGEESFDLELERTGLDQVKDVFKHTFKITHWPGYARGHERIQQFEFDAISAEVYENQSKKISKLILGNVLDNVRAVAQTIGIDLKITGESNESGSGIIPICTPLQAISWMNRNLLDNKNTPFYFFQNNQSEYEFISHSNIVAKESIGPYFYANQDSLPPGDADQYKQRKYRVIAAGGDLNNSKYHQMNTGLLSGKSTYVNAENKQISNHYYDYTNNFPLDQLLYSDGISVDDKSFGVTLNSPEANMRYIPADNSYMNWLTPERSSIMNAWGTAMSGSSFEITVTGNFDLKPGNVVDLQFPKIAGGGNKFDKYTSGRYIIIASTHTFESNQWYSRVLIKRDSLKD
jgi:hypothetical protein